MRSRSNLRKLTGVAVICSAGVLVWRLTARAQGSVTVTITPVSASSLTIGSAFGWKTTITNNTGGSLSLGNVAVLTYPNGTQFTAPPAPTYQALETGGATTLTTGFTTSTFTTQTGIFTLLVKAVDSSNTVWATATTTFNILALPSSVIPVRFSDIAASAGVNAQHHSDNSMCAGTGLVLPMGTGAGWADYDGDGLLDLFVTDFLGSSHLYKNNGDLTFTDVTATSGIPSNITHAAGVTWADYDNDGRPDLLVVTDGPPFLFHNNGDGTFTDVSVASGLTIESGRGTSAAWGDYDGDGYLDVYLVNYGECAAGPVINRQSDRLFHNNHDGTFSDVTNLLGGTTNTALLGHGFTAVWFDFNNDNRPDLYVVNDAFKDKNHTGDVLWRNDGPDGKGGWIFTNISAGSNTNQTVNGMGVAVGDFNRDGWQDLAYSNVMANYLQQNNTGLGTFTTEGVLLGVQRAFVPGPTSGYQSSLTWGIGFADLNNDGYEDLFMAGGQITGIHTSIPNALLLNNLSGHLTGLSTDNGFLDLTYLSGAQTPYYFNRTLAFADFDADGWVDVVAIPWTGTPQLYRNEGAADGNTNNWLEVRLNGVTSNRDGVGAKLTINAGGETQYRMIFSGTSLGAGSQVAAHFGLGTHTQVDSLQILWPSGQTQTFNNLAPNQRFVATEGSQVLGRDPTPPRLPSAKL